MKKRLLAWLLTGTMICSNGAFAYAQETMYDDGVVIETVAEIGTEGDSSETDIVEASEIVDDFEMNLQSAEEMTEMGEVILDMVQFYDDAEEVTPEENAAEEGNEETQEELTASGVSADGLTWKLAKDGVLTIGGSGKMSDYSAKTKTSPWYEYSDSVKSVVIESGVTGVGSYAFYKCKNMTAISLPDSVADIGSSAFSGCSSLTQITVPDAVKEIRSSTFCDCIGLKTITLSGNMTQIGYAAFDGCYNLTGFTLPDSVEVIEGYAFRGCYALQTIVIPDGVVTIAPYVFANCVNLSEVRLPSSVEELDTGAFSGCTMLKEITIADSVTSIADNAFAGTDVTIHCSESSYVKTYAFENQISCDQYPVVANGSCGTKLTWTVSNTGVLTVSGTGAMYDYTPGKTPWNPQRYADYVKKIVVSEGVTAVGTYAFENKSAVTEVTIPESVITIGSGAFDGCGSLTKVTYAGIKCQFEKNVNCSETDNEVFLKAEMEGEKGVHGALVTDNRVEPTCIATGLTEGSHCSLCEAVVTAQEVLPIVDHTFDDGVITTIATCKEKGVKTYTCSVCKLTKTEELDIVDHQGAEPVIENATEASCKTGGTYESVIYCEFCHLEMSRIKVAVPAGYHTPVSIEAVEATCTAEGSQNGIKCGICGEILQEPAVIAKKAHTEVIDAAVEATCRTTGVTEGSHCSVCGMTIKAQDNISATGKHTLVKDAAVAATCTKAGKTEGSHCSVCKTVIEAQKTVPATGHKWSAWTIKEATVSAAGSKTRTCSVCKTKETQTIAKLKATVKLSQPSLKMQTKQSATLTSLVTGLAKGDSIKSWSSDNIAIATVKNGKVTAKTKAGTVHITVTTKAGATAKFTITVQKKKVKTTAVTIPKKEITLAVKGKYTIKAMLKPYTSMQKITYKSSKSSVASVSSKGVITAKKKGIATITVKSGSKSVKIKVTVKAK